MAQGDGTKDRTWIVYGRPEMDGEVHPEEVAMMAQDVATVVRMCGGVSTSIAERYADDAGIWHTTAVLFRWSSFAPPAQAPRVAPQPQGEPVFTDPESALLDEQEEILREMDDDAPPVGADTVHAAPPR